MANKIPYIGLDCGHGLNTAGKETPTKIKEWTINDKVRDKVVDKLAAYECKLLHTDNNEGDVDESLATRLNTYLKAEVDSFVSIHHNAFKGYFTDVTGVSVYVDKKATAQDLALAQLIYDKLVAYTGLRGRGIQRADFYVINQNKIPAVLVEGGFMDGSEDYKIITSDKGQEAYAKAVAEALITYHSLKKKPVENNVEDSKTLYRVQVGAYNDKVNADKQLAKVKADGFDAIIVKANGMYKIQVGAYSVRTNAENQRSKLEEKGYAAFITTQGGVTVQTEPIVSPYYPKYKGTSTSVDKVLKAIGVPERYTGNYKNRHPLAQAQGIKNYTGTVKQNLQIISLAKEGKLKKI